MLEYLPRYIVCQMSFFGSFLLFIGVCVFISQDVYEIFQCNANALSLVQSLFIFQNAQRERGEKKRVKTEFFHIFTENNFEV